MKNILFYLILLPFWANAQTEKGATPLSPSHALTLSNSVTRAVVIGISDYQDERIPDLRFADRDAEAFASWLRSPAGGSLPENQIKVLTNKNATTGKMIAALDGLIIASKPGDEAIIYFSGHGDVERVTKFQRGFLLTYDSPPAVYAAGAFSLQYLQDIVTTLSEAGVQAVVITDACRAGKLAGSEFGGSKATSAALAQQFANEVKILSCQPEEFSLEGEQWGGGRGCFSYHLVDALYGMADANADGIVNLLELGRYLEDKVPAEAAPHSQIPFTVGSKAAQIASVNTEALVQWRQQKNGEAMAFKKIDSRGLEDLALAKADTGIMEMYHAFTAALDAGNLMLTDSSVGQSADDYYKLLIQEPSIADLHGLMTRNFAAALMDEGQQVFNRLLKGDLKAWEMLESEIGISYRQIADKYHRAAELVGEKHYYYPRLKAHAIYFDTYDYYNLDIPYDSIRAMDIKGTRQAHLMDTTSPVFLMNLANLLPIDSIGYYIERLQELAPNWALWHNIVASQYWQNKQFDMASQYFQNAVQLDSNYLLPIVSLSVLLEQLGRHEEAIGYQEMSIRIAQAKAEKRPASLASEEWHSLAIALHKQRRYVDAERALLQDEKYNPLIFSPYDRSWYLFADMGKYDRALQRIKRQMSNFPKNYLFGLLGRIYYLKGQLSEAEAAFKNGLNDNLSMESTFDYNRLNLAMLYKKQGKLPQAESMLAAINDKSGRYFFDLAEIKWLQGKTEAARISLDSLLGNLPVSYTKQNSQNSENYSYQIIALQRLGKLDEMRQAIEAADQALNGDPWHQFWMACAYAHIEQPEEAIRQLDLAEKAGWHPNQVLIITGTVYDPLLDPLRHLPAFQAWEQRWMPPYKDYSKE